MCGARNATNQIGFVLLSLLGCVSRQPPPPAHDPAAHGDLAAELGDQHEQAREQLARLATEMQRVALRLEREGTVDQTRRWQQHLSDIEHDRKLLGDRLQESAHLPEDDGAETRETLISTIEVLYVVGTKTAAEIDLALDRPGP